jgi:hypothetical protein
MSLFSTLVDAFKKAAGKQPTKPDVDMKTYGPLGSTTQEGGKSFTPLRPTPEADRGRGVDSGDLSVASADPEEGGEADAGEEVRREIK